MEPFSLVLITHAFTFFLGLVVSKVHNKSHGFLKPLLSNLSQIQSDLSDWFSFGRSRAAKANRLLGQVSVELLDRFASPFPTQLSLQIPTNFESQLPS